MDLLLPPEDKSNLLNVLPPQPLQWSKPVVDFSGLSSTAGSIDDFLSFSSHPHSSMSGSTLHSCLWSSTDSFPHKYPSLDFSPQISPSVISSLTISDLHHNPHYHELCQKYNELARVHTAYLGQDLGDSCSIKLDPHLDMHPRYVELQFRLMPSLTQIHQQYPMTPLVHHH